jgi:electron transfer flavoprotein beta subunit
MPNPADELELDDSRTDIDRDYVDMVTNEFDEQALEEAVLVKEATGAVVTAMALEAEGAEQALRIACARGADRAVLIGAGEVEPYDTRTAAVAFAEAVRELAPDLLLTGVQTPTDLFGQTAPYLATALDWPQASVVDGVEIVDGTAHVTQEYAGGRLAVLALQLPAVVGVQAAKSPPRYVSMARLRQAMSEASIETLSVTVLPTPPASTIASLARPEQTSGATMLKGDATDLAKQIAALLREQGALVS